MLLELSISDFAIIASSRISFGPGMHVLTGETGAGKSILLDALGAVLGERASVDLVRTGEKRARIEALFDMGELHNASLPDLLVEHGIDHDGSQLILTREIHANGRSVARINGQIVTISLLAQVGDALVDIHGQSDHFSIRRKEEQRRILDHYAGNETRVSEVSRLVERVQLLRTRIDSLATGERERAQRRDLLNYQIEEIDAATLGLNEDDQLMLEQRKLAHAEQLRADTERSLELISGDDMAATGDAGVGSLLRLLTATLGRVGEIDPSVSALVERSSEMVILTEDLGHDLRNYRDDLEVDESRLAEVEDRLEIIRTMKRKYGSSIEKVLRYRDEAAREFEELAGEQFDTEALSQQLSDTESDLVSQAVDVSNRRKVAAGKLAGEIEQSISALRLGNAMIQIGVNQVEDPSGLLTGTGVEARRVRFDHSGIDDVEILMAANRGEALRPLGRVASGGETARIMLAIKSIVSAHDATPTLVFDEIDVGVGGRTGHVVGARLRELSSSRQVIVITHLPQIAAVADQHSRILKTESNGRIVSTVEPLAPDAIEAEIAVMLDGEPITEAAIETARAMILRAQKSPSRVEA